MKDIGGDVAKALRDSAMIHESRGRVITDDTTRVFELQAIDALMREIAKPGSKPFHNATIRGQEVLLSTALGKRLISAVRYDLDEIRVLYPKAKFSPYFELFDSIVSPVRERLRFFDSATYKDWEALVASLRGSVNTREFSARRRAHERGPRKNYSGLVRYLRDLHSFNGRLLVIRLDVGYKIEHFQHVSFETMRRDKDALIAYIERTGMGVHLGHAWKIEHGQTRGFHTHMLLIYNGQRVQQDVVIAKTIGDHWVREVTGGKGYHHNANAHKEEYKFLGIGMLNRWDEAAREALDRVAAYMTKPDYHVRLLAPARARIFGRTAFPKNTPAKLKAALLRRRRLKYRRRQIELGVAAGILAQRLKQPRPVPVPRKTDDR